MTLGQRIQTHRTRLGLSQEGLGDKLGVSRQAVSKWEADGAEPLAGAPCRGAGGAGGRPPKPGGGTGPRGAGG